jgi:electron transport complex protein RnfB
VEADPVVDQIDALLPQAQCRQCSYLDCHSYAEAIAAGEADINQCPPGGEAGILVLADLLGRDPKPLNREYGEVKPKRVAVIDERTCIGCTLCLQVCPVDAILGAPKLMHTVIGQECTGCELCVAPCPMDCITFKSVRLLPPHHLLFDIRREQDRQKADSARRRHRFRRGRREREEQERIAKQHQQNRRPLFSGTADVKKAVIEAAVARAKAKKAQTAIRTDSQDWDR